MAPKYRQIPTKTPDSFDFNDIPTDFGRLFWLMLPIALDSEGRGIDNVQWLRSKLFPIREDDVSEQITTIMDWLTKRRMIVRYRIDGRKYFYSVNFKTYQTGTDKEAPSFLPAPPPTIDSTPDLLQTNSGLTPEQVRLNTIQCNAEAEAEASVPPASPPPFADYSLRVFNKVTGMFSIPDTEKVIPALEGLYYQHDKDEEKLIAYLKPFYQAWIMRKNKNGRTYSKSRCGWLYEWAVAGEIPPANSGADDSKPKMVPKTDPYGNIEEFPA